MDGQLREDFSERMSLVIYLKSNKYVNRLKHYGFLQYVSRKMHYAILYVDRVNKDRIIDKIEKEHFVDRVKESPKGSLELSYDGLLDELQATINRQKGEEDQDLRFY